MSIGGALVTGAGGGLGREIALRLGELGYTVHAVSYTHLTLPTTPYV